MCVFKEEYLAALMAGDLKFPDLAYGLLFHVPGVSLRMKFGENIAAGERMYELHTGKSLGGLPTGGRSQNSPGSLKQLQPELPFAMLSMMTVSLGA